MNIHTVNIHVRLPAFPAASGIDLSSLFSLADAPADQVKASEIKPPQIGEYWTGQGAASTPALAAASTPRRTFT